MATALELIEQQQQLKNRMHEMVELAESENRNFTAEEDANWNKINDDATALEKRIARQEQLERTPAAPAAGNLTTATLGEPQNVRATKEYSAAFRRYLAFGDDTALRALGTTVGSAGGLAVPTTLEQGIERARLAFGGMRQVSNVISTDDGGDLVFLTSNDTGNTGQILGENTQISEQDATVGAKVFKAFTFSSKLVRVSLQLLQDAAFDVEGYLGAALGERIGRIENTYFTTGTGANEPTGISNSATLGVTCATGKTTTVAWDDLIELVHSVGSAYRPNARFMFADSTLKILRKLKDGEGRYLWAPAMPQGGFPASIDGYPYTINDDVAAMAASARSILFGDFSHYVIRNVRGIQMLRFNERYGDYLQVGFTAFSRSDGGLVDAGANPIKYLANSAT